MMVRSAAVLALACLLTNANLAILVQVVTGVLDDVSGVQIGPATTMTNATAGNASSKTHQLVDCGTISSKHTHLVVKNPHYPEPTYVRAICETVIERSHPAINKLTIKLKSLVLYQPNYEGNCMHDRFAVYTDLNVPVTPLLCGNQTGKIITIPFNPPLSSLVVSISTSDLDHDRSWVLEIEQENWP